MEAGREPCEIGELNFLSNLRCVRKGGNFNKVFDTALVTFTFVYLRSFKILISKRKKYEISGCKFLNFLFINLCNSYYLGIK